MINLNIIIPCYNNSRHIYNCFNSIDKFLSVNNFFCTTVYFVNDGSIDKTEDVINQIILKERVYGITYLNKENGGASSARNYALQYIYSNKAIENEWFLFLDVDDELVEVNIENQFDSNIHFNIYDNFVNNKYVKRISNIKLEVSKRNPFVISCIIGKLQSDFLFDTELIVLEDWDLWIREFLIKNKSYHIFNTAITKINSYNESLSSLQTRMYYYRSRIGKKYCKDLSISYKYKRYFKINSLFNETSSFNKIVWGFIYSFPIIFNRVYLKLIVTLLYRRTTHSSSPNQ